MYNLNWIIRTNRDDYYQLSLIKLFFTTFEFKKITSTQNLKIPYIN